MTFGRARQLPDHRLRDAGWFSQVFDLDRPARLLRNAGIATAVTFASCIVIFIVFLSLGVRTSVFVTVVLAIAFLVLPLAWSLYVSVVVVVIAAHRPVSQPLRERNMLLAATTWVARLFWGSSLVVIGGFVGGFVAQQLAVISAGYESAGPQLPYPAPPSEAAVHSFIQTSDFIFWCAGAVGIVVEIALVYVVPFWISGSLIIAKKPAREAALSKWLRLDLDSPGANDERKQSWVGHLSYIVYPLAFIFVAALVGAVLHLLLSAGLDAAHAGVTDWLNSIRP